MQTNKEFIVHMVDDGWIFSAWENSDGSIQSYEFQEGNYPNTTICTWKDEEEFVKGVAWHPQLVDSLSDLYPDIKKRVKQLGV